MKKAVGRPCGRIKTAKIEISIDPNVKDRFMALVHGEGCTASGKIGEWIIQYIKEMENEKK